MVKARRIHHLAAIAFALCLTGNTPVFAEDAGPPWGKLTAQQQSVLAPLQQDWDKLDPERRKRWVGLADRYHSLPADRQQLIQQRMHEWASLTPEQRAQAIERYKRIKQLPPEKHEQLHQRWREYQALPEEQRQKLRDTHGAPGK